MYRYEETYTTVSVSVDWTPDAEHVDQPVLVRSDPGDMDTPFVVELCQFTKCTNSFTDKKPKRIDTNSYKKWSVST